MTTQVIPILHVDDAERAFGLEPQHAEWDENVRELELTDPDGNRLRVGQR